MRKKIVLVVLGVLTLASCATTDTETAAEPESISVTASDYSFKAPPTVPSGAVTIELANDGKEPHQAQLLKLNEGVDGAKVISAAMADPSGGAAIKLGTAAGGPNAVDPGESQVATVRLAPGPYVLMCLIPDAKGRAHAGLGMVRPLTVESNDDPAAVPSADYTATMKEFSFGLPEKWTGSISVSNKGKQPHEFQIMEIAPGKTAAEFEASFKEPPGQAPTGPPPWTTGGGVAVIDPGQRGRFAANLEPGTYYLMCFVPDPKAKAPHFALGMMQKFEVR